VGAAGTGFRPVSGEATIRHDKDFRPMSFKVVFPDSSVHDRDLLAAWPVPAGLDLAVHLAPVPDRATFLARVGDAPGVLLGWYPMDADVLAALPNLRVISFLGIGASDYVDLAAAGERGVTVCNTPGYGDDTVAEHAVALMLAVARHLPRFDALMRAGGWSKEPAGIELHGRTLGLVGFGGIARAVARIAGGLGLHRLAWTREPARHAAQAHALGVELTDLQRLFTEADVVSLHLPLTPQTEGLVGRALLERMKRDAILVNTARARLLDHDTLEQMLAEGRLFGAGLDVFPEEPCPDRPLLRLPNVVVTPHVGYHTGDALQRLLRIGMENVTAFRAGRPRNIVAAGL
jgi:D-3-phosphoglycerate dehydrogenase / 2-oxoglutarate reductase